MNTKIDTVTVEVAAHNIGVGAVLLGAVLLGVERVIQWRRMRRVFGQRGLIRKSYSTEQMLAEADSDDG